MVVAVNKLKHDLSKNPNTKINDESFNGMVNSMKGRDYFDAVLKKHTFEELANAVNRTTDGNALTQEINSMRKQMRPKSK